MTKCHVADLGSRNQAVGKGGWLEPTTKTKPLGLDFGHKIWEAFVSDKGDLGGAGEVQLRAAVGLLGCTQRRDWACSPCCPFSPVFFLALSHSKLPPLTLYHTYPIPPGKPGTGHVCLHWVVGERQATIVFGLKPT